MRKFFELVLTGSIMDLGKRFTEEAIATILTLRQSIITRLRGSLRDRSITSRLPGSIEQNCILS